MARDDSKAQVQLDEDTLARSRRVLGDDHPETLGSAALDLILRGLSAGEPERDGRAQGSPQEARGLNEDEPG